MFVSEPVGIRRFIQFVFFKQEGIASYKIIILGIAARVFVFEANFVTSFICQHSLFTVFSFLHLSDRQNCVPS